MGKGTWDELSKLINKYINRNKRKDGVVGIFTRKEIGKFPSIGGRMTNPLNRRDLALSEMTRERQYFLFKNYEKELLEDIIKVLTHVDKNNIKLGGELLKNLEYNFSTVKMLRKYNLKAEGIIRSGGSTPNKVLKDEAGAGPGEGIRSLKGTVQDLQSSMDEIMKLADEMKPENIAKKEAAEKALREKKFKKMWHGRAYEGRSDQYRGLSYQLAKLHEAGIIKLDDKIYDGIKEGRYHWGGAEFHTPDIPRVWRYHFGDDIFDKFDEVFEKEMFSGGDHTFVGPNAMVDWMKANNIKPIKVEGPKNALDYMDEVELKAHIDDAEEGINIFKSDDHFWKGHENEAEMTMQSIVQKAEEKKRFIDALEKNYPKAHKKFVKEWKERTDKDFTPLSKALENEDYRVISEGDEEFKEISEKLGITARPGDNLKLEDNVIQGPWKGTKPPVTHQEKIDWLVKNVDPNAKQTIPPKETLEQMVKDGRGDLIDHFYEMHTKNLGKPDINIDTSDLKHPGLVKKIMTDEKLKPTEVTYSITDHIEYIKTLKPIDAMKEANKVLKGEGRYKNLSKADQETIVNDETVTDHIFERNPPEDPEFAQGGRVGYSQGGDYNYHWGHGDSQVLSPEWDEGFDNIDEINRMLKQDQVGNQASASSGELEDLLQRLGMVVDGMGIYSDYNQTQRKQMQRSLTSRINVLLAQ